MSPFRRSSWREALRRAPDARLLGATLVGPSGPVAHTVMPATTPWRRARGMLGRDVLADTAMIIAPCTQVHTVGMRGAIDAVFCDADMTVLNAQTLRPGRLSRIVRRASCCIELPAGTADAHGIAPGVRLHLERGTEASEATG